MEDKGTLTATGVNGQRYIAESDSTPNQGTNFSENVQVYPTDTKSGKDIAKKEEPDRSDPSTGVNMEAEATISPDDVLRAGGFGARDDLSSPLPVAIDSTDFEASLRDARDYEEPQGAQTRPGLGWHEKRD